MKKDYYLFIQLAQYITKKILHHKLQQINIGLKKSTVGMINGTDFCIKSELNPVLAFEHDGTWHKDNITY